MRRKSAYFILTVVVALAAVFAARQRTLYALRAVNDSLRGQIESKTSALGAAFPEPPAAPAARLNGAEEKELLRLRAAIVPLREQLRDASNSIAILQRPQEDAASEAMIAGARSEIDTNIARLGKAMSQYLREHDGEPPAPGDLTATVRELDTNLPAEFLQRFELLTTNSGNCIAWEKQPELWPGGGTIRVFVLTNGEAFRYGPLPPESWADWESNHPQFLTDGKALPMLRFFP
jgi:hypothetical protein